MTLVVTQREGRTRLTRWERKPDGPTVTEVVTARHPQLVQDYIEARTGLDWPLGTRVDWRLDCRKRPVRAVSFVG